MKRPFFPVFVFSIILLFISKYFPDISPIFIPLLVIFSLSSVIFYIFKSNKTVNILIAFAVSFGIASMFADYRDEYRKKIDENDFPVKQYIGIKGKIIHFPEMKKENTILTVKVDSIILPGEMVEKRDFTIKISVNGRAGSFVPGENVTVDCIVGKRNFRENFFPNPMKDYMLSQGVHFNGHTKSVLLIRRNHKASLFFRIVSKLRRDVKSAIESMYLIDNGGLKPPGQLLEALLLGDRGRLDKDIKERLLNVGVFHLFAISGAHIGVIALFSLFILGKFRIKKRIIYGIVIIILLLFLSLTGFKVSAQRAVIMAVFILMGKIFYLKSDILNTISFSGLFILLLNPAQFLDPGFILTFSITFGIVAGRDLFLSEPKKMNEYIKELFITNLSASIISLPLSLFFFKRYSFLGFFAGFLLFPLTGVIMAASFPLILLSFISLPLAKLLMLLILPFIELFFFIVKLFSSLSLFIIFRPSPSLIYISVLLFLFFIPKIFRIGNTFRYLLIFLSALSVIFFSIKPSRYNPSSMEVFFLDVGQGDSEVVVFPGGDALLIDGGGSYFSEFEVGKQIVLPFLIQKKIDVRWIAVSHFHPDHCRGIIEIINILDPQELWISSFPVENLFLKELLAKKNKNIIIKKTDFSFCESAGNCIIDQIFPEKILHTFYEHNNNSQVLRISDKKISFLFTGDIEEETERVLTKKVRKALKSRILKVPHHGSRTSSTEGFLKMVSPEIAVISLSKTNRFGFPHAEVLKRYRDLGIKILRTSIRGGIQITSEKGRMVVKFSKYSGYH